MADPKRIRDQNLQGNFFVDDSCIDCGTCYWMAPSTFDCVEDQAAVVHQPMEPVQRLEAARALVSCPTSSIGTHHKPEQVNEAIHSFPMKIAENVSHCGFHSEKSFGAASYFIERPEGNILVDSPRFANPLMKNIEARGGIRYHYLTHKDDVADHRLFQKHFGCERILHRDDHAPSMGEIEILLEGEKEHILAPDLKIIPVPGHTKGHTVLLYRDRYLFTGDHLAWSPSLKHLYAFRRACWYSWEELKRSMSKLRKYPFEWVLPGHGRRTSGSREEMQASLEQCLAWMNE